MTYDVSVRSTSRLVMLGGFGLMMAAKDIVVLNLADFYQM